MLLNKSTVQQNFDRACHSYNDLALIQKECARLLSQKITSSFPHFIPSSILDLGTGTGYVPECLIEIYPNSHYTLNDLSPKMLEKAKEKFSYSPQFTFHAADMEEVGLGFYDLTISNFALQWVNSLKKTIEKYYTMTEMLAFSLLLEGTLNEWKTLLKHDQWHPALPIFPPLQKVLRFLQNLTANTFIFDVQEFRLSFNTTRQCIKYFQSLGAQTTLKKIPFSLLKEAILNPTQKIDITYCVLFAILKKTS